MLLLKMDIVAELRRWPQLAIGTQCFEFGRAVNSVSSKVTSSFLAGHHEMADFCNHEKDQRHGLAGAHRIGMQLSFRRLIKHSAPKFGIGRSGVLDP